MNEVAELPQATNPFGTAVSPRGANALAGVAEQRAIAEVQAKLLMAQRFPRDEVACMDRILNAFTRPRLAEQAKYQYARGGSDIDGPSIRAAESMAQQWQNLEFGFRELSRHAGGDGVTFSQVEAYCFDMQNRTRRALEFNVRHWRDTKNGGYALKDERDIYELMANYAQRRVRACILAIIPGDVVEAAMNQAEVTLRSKADTSPEAMQKMVEAFEPFGVNKELIEKRIQRRLDAIQPAQVVTLKKIYSSLRDGMSAAHDWFEIEPPAAEGSPAVDAINAKLASKSSKATQAKPASNPKEKQNTAAAAEAAADSPAMSFAEVMDKLQAAHKAKDVDAIDQAADLVGSVEDADQRQELTVEYRRLRKELQA